jgi:hypothetical protein
MHDLDRTLLEYGSEEVDQEGERESFEYAEEDGFEQETEGEGETEGEIADSPFSEVEEIDLASELLAITDEGELDQFLGGLMKRASKAAGKFLKSPTGRALGGILKAAAKKALPVAGKAAGAFFGGPAGAALGGKLASLAGQQFGLELEGLSEEDAQFEVARQFVRLGGAATVKAADAPPTVQPMSAAQAAMAAAARRHAPGLLGRHGNAASGSWAGGRSGRWIRRGRKIILLGV